MFLLMLLLCHVALSQTTVTMQHQGRDTVYLNPTSSYTILDPGGYSDYGQNCKDTLVLISYNHEPFILSGTYTITSADYFAIFQGSNTHYPLENFYSGEGTINIYCHEGAITIIFFSRRTVGATGFEFSLCFPTIRNPHVERTNSHYTNVCWSDESNYAWQVSYTIANSESTTYDTTYTTTDSLTTLGAGEKYHYQIIAFDDYTYCTTPLLSFRTPKVEDCNTCDHYRNCIDFATLTQNNSQVYCFKGTTDEPDEMPCVVDDGNASTSRHIVLDTTYTTDERTGNQLNIIPNGESNVVRLGNYSEGSQGESIMYELHIDTNDYDLMILRYAMVMKQLSTYSNLNPRISIRLTDENCRPVKPLCYCRDYIGDTNSRFWNTSSWSNSQYLWHDWQSMAIDVSEYHGKTLYLQLSTHDGKNTLGSAYMYFTLHCSRKQIDHLRLCGNNIENTFFAPEGFNYRWYNTATPGITLSTTDSLHVTDSGFYQCWVTPRECYDNTCGYTINALASPRYPKADFDYLDTTGRCTFTIKFINRSTINYSPDSDTPLWTREDCETAYWNFGNGQTSTEYNPEVVYDTAGIYRVTLISGIAGDNCQDTITKYIVLNWQYGRPYIEGPRVLCPPSIDDVVTLSVTNNSGTPTWCLNGEWFPMDDFPLFRTDLLHSNYVLCAVSDSNGCSDTLRHDITILPEYNNTIVQTICQAQLDPVWTWRGHEFYPGEYTRDHYYEDTTRAGCDSNVTLRLIINETYNRYYEYVFCDYATEFPYPPNADNPLVVFDTVGEHSYTFHTALGCDSIIHLNMRKHVVDHDTIRHSICQGTPFDTLDFHYSAAHTNMVGTLSETHTATEQSHENFQVQSCDSTMTLILTINPHNTNSRSYVRNESQLPLTFCGVDFYHSVTDTIFRLTNRYGCDSLVHLSLHVNYNIQTHLYDTICDNALPYTWDGLIFDSASVKPVALQRANGTDSIVYRHLTVHPTFAITTHDTICDDGHITFCGNNYTAANTYIHNLQSSEGCDSIETLVLTVNQTHNIAVSDTICSNQPYSFAGQNLTTTNVYSEHLQDINGCDSLVTLTLTVNPASDTTIAETIVENDLPHTFNGRIYDNDANGDIITLTNRNGCDSTIHYYLTINWNQSTVIDQTICFDLLAAGYNWDGTLFSVADLTTATVPPAETVDIVKQDTLTGYQGVDSVVTRRLHVNPTFSHQFADTICDDATYTFVGKTYNSTGTYTHHLTTVANCDSTVTLALTVHAVTHSIFDTTIIENALAEYLFNGHSFTGEVSHTAITITNTDGCDSIIDFSLHIIPNVSTQVDSTVCASLLPLLWNGKNFTAAGTQSALLHTSNGADSLVAMTLHVNPVYDDTTRTTICDNESISFNGTTYNHTCIHTDILMSAKGCDSVTTLVLTVNAVTYSDLYDTIVENQMPYTLNGTTYPMPETELIAPLMRYLRDTTVIANAKGCDSVIDLRLYVHLNVYDTVDSTICDNLLPLQWNNRTFTDYEFGVWDYALNDTLTAWTGADSILTMRLHVNPTYDLHLYDTICSNDQVIFNDSTYTLPGVYVHPLTSSLQCDSLVTLHLTVFGTSAANINDTIVENLLKQTYTFNGVIFDTMLFGPDQQVSSRFSQIDSTIIITNQIGCDSTIHYRLCVHWNIAANADSTICENYLPLSWNARTFSRNDILQQGYDIAKLDTLIAHTGADSLLTMRLHVDTNSSSDIADTVLENTLPHTFNGVTYTLAQMEAIRDSSSVGIEPLAIALSDTITIANEKGCDSVIYHALFIRWNKTTIIADTICENYFPYIWQGRTIAADSSRLSIYNEPFTLVDTIIYTASGGEDSLVVMHLHVKRNSLSTLFDTIVENQMNHNWNGATFTWDDTVSVDIRHADLQHTGVISNAAGCDSVAAMNLMVWLNRTAAANSSVCENYFAFTWNGVLFDSSDSKNVLLATTQGADSLLTMNVTKLFNSTSTITDTIVENQLAYNFNESLFDHSHFGDTATLHIPPSRMTFIDTTVLIANGAGCDSIISYRLNVWWNVRNGIDDTLCSQALPHQWNSRTFTQADADTSPSEGRWKLATLYDTLAAWSGADSILAMRLHVMPSFYINFNDTVCSSSYIAWYGDTLYETGVYPMAFNTIDGCDSIEYLHFANYPNYDFEYYDTICDYSGMMRIGVEYMGAAHLPTMNGCDSNEIYHLWGMPVSYSNVDTIVSEHLIPFAYNNEWFADSGTSQRQFILTNQYGCDSVVNFTITVMPTIRQTLDSSVCDVMMPLDWDGTIFNYVSGVMNYQIVDTLPGAYGADSIVTRRVHVSPSFNLDYYDTTCNGAPYHFGDSIYTATGVYSHNYHTTITDPVFGVRCDSIEALHLQVNAMSYATVHDTIVENQLPYTFGNVTFTTTAQIIDSTITILNTVACDSVITYSLYIYPNSYNDKDTTLCDNQLPFTWDGRSIAHGGMDSVVVLMPDGTDSVTRYWTVVHPTYNITDTVRTCDSYEWIDGNTYTESIVVNGFTLASVNGCDSVKNLRLTIDHQTTTHDSIASCDPYTWIDSVTYSTSVSGPTYLLQTVHGCDSTVVLDFTKYTHKVTELYDTICRGVSYLFGGVEYSETGVYADSLLATTGCDSVVLLNLHVLEPPTVGITWECDCDTRIYTVTGHCDVPYFEWNSFPEDPALTGHTHDRTIQLRPTTHETYYFFADYKDVPTCPADTSINLSPLLRPHALIEYTPEFLTYDQLHMSAISRCTNEETRQWFVNGNDMGVHERISYIADPRTDDSVVVMLTAHHGICHDTDLVVIPFRKATIWVPNTFTPEESSNNLFFVRYIGITDYKIDLYTRGGVLVWHSEDMNDGWDGTYKGKPCPQETYVWIIHYRDVTAPKNLLSKKGTVTLLR